MGIQSGDAILLSGNLGDHHAAILSARMGIKNSIKSDCALLAPITRALCEADVGIHAMRDVTRGGLGTVLNELAIASNLSILLEEERIPVSPEVKAFCSLMGLDPIYMGNEGKMVLAVASNEAECALAAMRRTEIGRDASLIGYAQTHATTENPLRSEHPISQSTPPVSMRTTLGGTIRVDVLYGEGLPRIC